MSGDEESTSSENRKQAEEAERKTAEKKAAAERQRLLDEQLALDAIRKQEEEVQPEPSAADGEAGSAQNETPSDEQLNIRLQAEAKKLIDEATREYLTDLNKPEKRTFGFMKRQTRLNWTSGFLPNFFSIRPHRHGPKGRKAAKALRVNVGLHRDPSMTAGLSTGNQDIDCIKILADHFRLRKGKESLNSSSLDTYILKKLDDHESDTVVLKIRLTRGKKQNSKIKPRKQRLNTRRAIVNNPRLRPK